jgi:hypothetical protein
VSVNPDPAEGTDPASTAPDEEFRAALAELEEYLDGMPEEKVGELVLPFASRWVLLDAGLDLARLREEADTFAQATPEWERVLLGYPKQLASWVSERMLLDEHGRPQPERTRTQLAASREALARRAELVEAEGFPGVAAALRRLLEETAGGSPPTDLLWSALALRIAESALG